jgi:hypothetical protein
VSATAAARPQPPPAARRPRSLLPAGALPGLIALAAGVILGPLEGGFPAGTWYPAALFLLALGVLALVAAPPSRSERSRAFGLALTAYGGFVAWSYLSILWADGKGDAWDGANRTLLYGVVLAVVGMRPWGRRAGSVALGVVAFGTALVAAGTLVVTATRSNASALFLDGRLSDPIGYANATADLWLIAFWPALHLARTETVRWGVRALAAGSATLLLETAVLSQSRGSLIGFALGAVVYVAIVPRRLGGLLTLAGVLALTALSWTTLVGVHDVRAAAGIGPAVADARLAIFLSFLAAVTGAAVAIAVGRRWRPGELSLGPGARQAGRVAALAIGVVAIVAAAIAVGNPVHWTEARWHDFKYSGYEQVDTGQTRFTGSLGSDRYDFYRVALNEFLAHPVQGIGADNFGQQYLRHRRGTESPRYPHSNVFRLLAQLGVIGTLLFAVFVWLALRCVRRAMRGSDPITAGIAAAALAGSATWFFHGMGDWLWEFPALGILGMGLLTLAMRAGPPPVPTDPADEAAIALGSPYDEPSPLRGPAWSSDRRAALGLAALAAALSFALPGIAARYTSAAYDGFQKDPAKTLARLERASDLNPLSAEPLLAKGLIAERLGQTAVARDALQRAIDREPTSWFAHFELALVDAESGHPVAADAALSRAARLNPRQPLIAAVGEDLASGRRPDQEMIEHALYSQVRDRLTSTQQRRR